VAAASLDAKSIVKELGATALIVGALTVTVVGFHIKDVPGGIALETRFVDVLSAIVIGMIGRGWLILLRERRPSAVFFTALPVAVLLIIALLSETLLGVTAVKNWLPFQAVIVQWILAVLALGLGIAGGVRMRQQAREDEEMRRRAAAAAASGGEIQPLEAEETFMDRVSARVQQSSTYIGLLLFVLAAVFPFMPFTNLQYLDIGVLVMTYVMLGWGLNIVVGLAGLLDLGYVAFYAVGAYSFALLASPDSPLLHDLGIHQGISCGCAATIWPSSRSASAR
jgi:branched-chain amino acid transport system permease protein